MYRSNSYDDDFSNDMKSSEARYQYLYELIQNEDEPMTIEDALKFTARRMGIVEFSKLVGEKKQNIDKFLKGERRVKIETLDKYLYPFGLQAVLSVKSVDSDQVA